MRIFPNFRGENKKYLKPPPRLFGVVYIPRAVSLPLGILRNPNQKKQIILQTSANDFTVRSNHLEGSEVEKSEKGPGDLEKGLEFRCGKGLETTYNPENKHDKWKKKHKFRDLSCIKRL